MKRAIRRHHSQRMAARTAKLLLAHWGDIVKKDKIFLAEKVRRCYNNYTICSCPMCGNPRRSGWDIEKTLAERKNDITFKEETEI
jgi:hypothetical protein